MASSEPQLPAELLAMMEQLSQVTSTMTGVKNQFIAQGWSVEASEQMTALVFQMALKGQS